MGMVFGYQVIFVFVDGHCINTLHALFILKFPKSFHKFKVQNFKLYFDQQCFEYELVNPNFDPLDPSKNHHPVREFYDTELPKCIHGMKKASIFL